MRNREIENNFAGNVRKWRKRMFIDIDKSKIVDLLKDFYTVTGLRVGLFGLDGEEIASYPKELSKFCHIVKQNSDGMKRCIDCDKSAFEESTRIKGLHIYKCHMNLTEAVLPITHEGTVIAFMMFGQVYDRESEIVSNQQLVKIFSEDEIKSLQITYKDLQEMPHDKIEAIAKMLGVYASYIRFSDLIFTYNGGVAPLIKSYIEQNIDKPLSIEIISQNLNIGKTTICIKFKGRFNLTVNSFITRARIKKACLLLRETTQSATEISMQCGFSDYNYFIRQFKKVKGIPPMAFRKEILLREVNH